MDNAVNRQLREFYDSIWPHLLEIMSLNPQLSWPHLLKVSGAYVNSKPRIMIFGQQTYEWFFDRKKAMREVLSDDPIEHLMDADAHFVKEKNPHYNSPFWDAVRMIDDSGDEPSILWNNLLKMDLRNRRPGEEVEVKLNSSKIVRKEIEITQPRAIVLFVGPNYRTYLDELWPGAAWVGDKWLQTANYQDQVLLHTYHPKHLRLKKRWDVVDSIASEIRSFEGKQ